MEVVSLRVMGRNTQGVKLIRLKNEDDEISSVTKIRKDPAEEIVAAEEAAPVSAEDNILIQDETTIETDSEIENLEIEDELNDDLAETGEEDVEEDEVE